MIDLIATRQSALNRPVLPHSSLITGKPLNNADVERRQDKLVFCTRRLEPVPRRSRYSIGRIIGRD
jgi:hypothetical protein